MAQSQPCVCNRFDDGNGAEGTGRLVVALLEINRLLTRWRTRRELTFEQCSPVFFSPILNVFDHGIRILDVCVASAEVA